MTYQRTLLMAETIVVCGALGMVPRNLKTFADGIPRWLTNGLTMFPHATTLFAAVFPIALGSAFYFLYVTEQGTLYCSWAYQLGALLAVSAMLAPDGSRWMPWGMTLMLIGVSFSLLELAGKKRATKHPGLLLMAVSVAGVFATLFVG